MDHAIGAVPPLAGTVKVKAVPLIPAASAGVVAIVGTGAMWIVMTAALLLSVADVAVTVAVAAAPVAGALYVTAVALAPESVPGPDDNVQVTPPLLESLATVTERALV